MARRDLKKLPRQIQIRVIEKLTELSVDPRPPSAKPLTGLLDVWRVRVGDYRILYAIKDEVLLVLVLRIGNRREIYRLVLPSLAITPDEEDDGTP